MPHVHRILVRLLALVVVASGLGLVNAVGASGAAASENSGTPTRARTTLAAELLEEEEPARIITGLVYDQSGELLDGILVEALLLSDPSGHPVASDLTYEHENSSSHGAFALHVPAGDYLVRYSSPEWDGGPQFETSYYGGGAGTPVRVGTEDVALDDVTLVRDTGAPVTGTVLDAAGEPMAGVSVALYRILRDNESWDVDWDTTDASGHYTFERVNRARAYTVYVHGEWINDEEDYLGYPDVFLGHAPAAGLADTFTLPPGSAGTTLDPIVLAPGVQVTGSLRHADGSPVTHTHFEFHAVVDGARHRLGDQHSDLSEDEPGAFAGALLPGYTYTVSAYDHEATDGFDGDSVYLGDTYDAAQAETFTVTAGTPVTLDPITLVPNPAGRYVTGTVVATSGSLPESTYAYLGAHHPDWGWDWPRSAPLGADGAFTLKVPNWVDEEGYGPLTVRIVDEAESFPTTYLGDVTDVEQARTFPAPGPGDTEELGSITVTMPEQATITGSVLRAGEPAAGVEVVLFGHHDDWGWDWLRDTTTGADGTFTIRFPESAREDYTQFTLRAEGSGFYEDVYLGGGTSLEEASTFGAPEPGAVYPAGTLSQAVPPNALYGDVTAADGGSFGEDYETTTTLYRWVEWCEGCGGGWEYWDSYHAWDDTTYAFFDVPPGIYTLESSVHVYDGTSPYLPTWSNGTHTMPEDAESDGTFVLGDTDEPVRGPSIALERGVRLGGTVTGSTGGPLSGVSVGARIWGPDGLSYVSHFDYTGDDGAFAVVVPKNSAVWLSADRTGYEPYYLGGEPEPATQTPENAIAVAESDVTHDFSMTPVWGAIGAVAGEKHEYCLANRSGFVEFDGREFYTYGGQVSDAHRDSDEFQPFHEHDRDPALVLLGTGGSADRTWGVSPDGGTLCLQYMPYTWWGGSDAHGYTAQILMTKDPEGGYDVTYNYDNVASSPPGSYAGFTEGEGADGQVVLFPGGDVENGYADSDESTGLVRGSYENGTFGTGTRGRYTFHFDGFNERRDPPEATVRPTITADPGYTPGSTLTATPGTWSVDGVETSDLEFTYVWRRRNGAVLQEGSSPIYQVTSADAGRRIRLEVRARAPWHEIGHAWTPYVLVGEPSASNDSPPSISPSAGRVGDTFQADPGAWTPAATATTDLKYRYVWLGDGVRVGTGPTFTASENVAGKTLTVRVGAQTDGHITVWAESAPVEVAELEPLAWSNEPSLTGSPQVGNTLQLDPGTIDGGAAASTTIRWAVGGLARNPDAGSDGFAFTPRSRDAGKYVTAKITASAPGFQRGTWSATVGPVAPATAELATLTVQVRDGSGASVPGSWVTVCDSDNTSCLGGEVDGSGNYATTGVAGYTYRVAVQSGSDSLTDKSVTVAMPGDGSDRTQVVTLTAPPTPPTNVEVPGNVGSASQPTIVPSRDQTFVVNGCATTASPRYTIAFGDGSTVVGPMRRGTVSGDLAPFTATVPAWQVPTTQFVFRTNIPANCAPSTPSTEITVYIDPSGYVTDQYGRPLAGATVTLLRADDMAGPFVQVPDGSPVMSDDNRSNPSITTGTGFFRWDVTEGWYKVQAAAGGCQPTTTEPMQVEPARVDLLIKLTCDVSAPTMEPQVAGTAKVGETLTTDTSAWASLFQPTVQWLRDGVRIEGATDTSYALTAADQDATISVRHTATRPTYVQEEGRGAPVSFAPAHATSGGVEVAQGTAPTGTVSITGLPKVGQKLSATPGTWSRSGLSFAYTWKAGGKTLAIGPTYTVKPGDIGTTITVTAVGSKEGYADGSATSAGVKVAKVTPTVTLKLLTKKLKASTRGKVQVVVVAAGIPGPTGNVTILDGKKVVGSGAVSSAAKGVVTIKLKKLKKGTHTLVASFAGSSLLAPATSKAVKVKVK